MVGRGVAARREAFKASLLTSAALLAPSRRAAARRLYSGYGLLFLATRAAPAAALALLWLQGEARAVCAPNSPVNNADVTCTGTTVNQNGASGYGGFGDTGNTITLVPGASVTGTGTGIVFNSGTVANSGAISGGTGIAGITGTVSNAGTITGGIDGIFVTTVTVSNSGTISGGTSDGIAGITANVSNSGAISGGTSGINANATATVSNSGTISGGTVDGIAAATANVSNSGAITGGIFGINATAIANVTNSGAISGGTNGIATTTANVTNSGSISGGIGEGIEATNAKVSNSGAISGGATGRGILASGTADVSNSGTISGAFGGITASTAIVSNSGAISAGAGASGIFAGTTTVNNSGTISGEFNGITGTAAATVSNSGTIAGGMNGIFTAIANVTNSGSITVRINDGIVAFTTANVSNSGTISGGRDGIRAFGAANVSNSSTIAAGRFGIFASNTANVSNSGTISGGTAALQFAGNPDTLTLLPGSRIIGAINLGGGGDTVNFQVRNQNLTFDTLASATITSTVPFAVSGNRVATIDPTAFAMSNRLLMDFSRGVSEAIPDSDGQSAAGLAMAAGNALAFAGSGDNAAARIADGFAAIPGLSAYADDSAVFKNPTMLYRDGTTLWTRGFAGERVQQRDGDSLLHTVNRFYGGMFGGDWLARPDLRLGAFIGGGYTRSTVDFNYGDTTSTLVFGGLFGRYSWGASYLRFAVQGGHSSNDSTRNINNNLAPGGLETAKASFGGWYVSPEATYGVNFALGSVAGATYTLTPSLRVRYLHAAFDGFSESGSTAPLTVGDRTADHFEERGQLKLTRTAIFTPTEALITSIFGGVLGDQRAGDKTINATLLGQAIPFAAPGKDNVWGGFGGAGLEWRAGPAALFVSAEYLALSDSSSVVSGQGGLRVAF